MARQKRLAEYDGPDEKTILLLESNASNWSRHPENFFHLQKAMSGSNSSHILVNVLYDYGVIDRDII